MKIAFFDFHDQDRNFIKKKLTGHHVEFFPESLTSENVSTVKDFDIVSVFIDSKLDKELIGKMPKLKLIAAESTGVDHIDIKTCKKKHITVCHIPLYGVNTVAEHTFALILCLSRNIFTAFRKSLRHDYSLSGLEGFDIKGKIIGVIGTGNIGLHVIRIAHAFGMEILAYDVHPNSALTDIIGFTYVSLEELLAQSDIVTIHVPYMKETHHLINTKTIHQMKRGAILINTSRGAIVDNNALIEGLDTHILAGAGLDVIEGEELIKEERQILHDPRKIEDLGNLMKDHDLLSRDNVVFTPHIAFYSREAVERIFKTNIQNIVSFIKGEPQNVM